MMPCKSSSIEESLKTLFSEATGVMNIGILHSDLELMTLATNNGAYIIYIRRNKNIFVFASESYFLNEIKLKYKITDTEIANYQLSMD